MLPETFSMLGKVFPPSDLLVSQLHRFVCLMYGDKIAVNTAERRYNLFKSGKYSDDVLPPNSDCLLKHIERANYQTAVWNQSLLSQMNVPTQRCSCLKAQLKCSDLCSCETCTNIVAVDEDIILTENDGDLFDNNDDDSDDDELLFM